MLLLVSYFATTLCSQCELSLCVASLSLTSVASLSSHCCLTLALTTACTAASLLPLPRLAHLLLSHCIAHSLPSHCTTHSLFSVLTCMFLMFDCVTFTGSETLTLKQQTRKRIGWKRCSDELAKSYKLLLWRSSMKTSSSG